eukprot:Rhum_TRINITY_DN10744_c1_g2::Rhum_TRINITY_DN10744_c1_g2_i1::g.39869::m.39869
MGVVCGGGRQEPTEWPERHISGNWVHEDIFGVFRKTEKAESIFLAFFCLRVCYFHFWFAFFFKVCFFLFCFWFASFGESECRFCFVGLPGTTHGTATEIKRSNLAGRGVKEKQQRWSLCWLWRFVPFTISFTHSHTLSSHCLSTTSGLSRRGTTAGVTPLHEQGLVKQADALQVRVRLRHAGRCVELLRCGQGTLDDLGHLAAVVVDVAREREERGRLLDVDGPVVLLHSLHEGRHPAHEHRLVRRTLHQLALPRQRVELEPRDGRPRLAVRERVLHRRLRVHQEEDAVLRRLVRQVHPRSLPRPAALRLLHRHARQRRHRRGADAGARARRPRRRRRLLSRHVLAPRRLQL